MFDIDSSEAAAFRAEVREFVRAAVPAETRHKIENGLHLDKADFVNWQKILYKKGWFPAAWPREYGGAGWNIAQQQIFNNEAALCGAPDIVPYGVGMLGPVVYTFGTPEQKEKYLPDIRTSDTWWCQGYSEPNSGSDLASLGLSAVRDGDVYVLNGTKMWTTEAQWADKMHCLVRTDKTVKKQAGITFLLLDMDTPGLKVEPIVTLDRVHHTNQVFFDNVRVPVENRIGNEGDGWKMAKFLLANERTSITGTGAKLAMLEDMKAAFQKLAAGTHPGHVQTLRVRLADMEARLTTLIALERHYISQWMAGHNDGIGPSILKIRGTELLQAMSDLWADLLGPYGACYDVKDYHSGAGLSANEPWVGAAPVNFHYLYGRCWSIFGGTNEIQRNIIGGTLLAR